IRALPPPWVPTRIWPGADSVIERTILSGKPSAMPMVTNCRAFKRFRPAMLPPAQMLSSLSSIMHQMELWARPLVELIDMEGAPGGQHGREAGGVGAVRWLVDKGAGAARRGTAPAWGGFTRPPPPPRAAGFVGGPPPRGRT